MNRNWTEQELEVIEQALYFAMNSHEDSPEGDRYREVLDKLHGISGANMRVHRPAALSDGFRYDMDDSSG
ncbi:hypothetical protein [Paenibacillus sp. y28]|uniref:hypothetical protein n=1 Tax=Paenibacillus sp. y28 TaxID=3129110 RepID=UPI00301868C6